MEHVGAAWASNFIKKKNKTVLAILKTSFRAWFGKTNYFTITL